MKRKRRGRGEGAVFFAESKDAWVGRVIIGARPDGQPHYQEVTARTKGDVLARMRQVEKEVQSGRPARITVGAYFGHWLHNVARPAVEATTWEVYARTVRVHIVPRLGGLHLAQVTPQQVEAFFAGLHKDDVRGLLARKVSQVLSNALRHA